MRLRFPSNKITSMLWQVSYWVVPMNDLGRKVLGYGPVPAEVALVGEAPGEQEVEDGVPFVGKSGIELNGHYLPLAGLTRAKVYVTNLWKYRPPNNRDPNAAEIAEGLAELLPELAEVNPTVIVAVGRLSAGALLGRPVDMDKEHGIPIAWKNRVLLPVYHPAAGLHNTAMMSRIREDFTALRHLLIGVTQVPVIEPAEGWYEELHDMPHNGERRALLGDVVAVDTETDLGRPYCVQFSSWEGAGFLIRADNAEALADLGRHLAQPHVTTVMHNARFDIKVLLELGIHPAKVEDTMTMAYLLGNLPQRLKALAYRLLHVRMQEYSDVVAGSEAAVAMEWLEAAALREYPVPEPVLEMKGNKFKVRQPQRYEKRLQALLKKARKNPALDVAEALRNMKDIEPVIDIMGEVPESSVALIAPDRLVDYACADADMTLRVRNVLMPRIIEAGLEGVFARDMAAMVMVVAMEQAGMQIDVGRCEALAAELDADAWRLFNEVNEAMRLKPAAHGTGAYLDADCWFNPGSPDQMMKYLNAYGRYPKSTEAKYVKPYVAKDPVIAQILDYKHLVKLRSTYAVALPRKADVAGRVHTKLEMTRTETGRLASKEPNLSNIPVRDKLGNRIREAFVAKEGSKILSIDYCLAAGHGVITTEGTVPIEHIKPGMSVLSCIKGTELCFSPVTAATCVGKMVAYAVKTEESPEVICSSDHTWMLFDGTMCKTYDLQEGMRLAHVKDGFSGKYPTWYIRTHCNYKKKHSLVAEHVLGKRPEDNHVDHIDGNRLNWYATNLRHLHKSDNSPQGGQRYWRAVKEGSRTDTNRLDALRVGLKGRRSYTGEGNPNFGKLKGSTTICAQCGVGFYRPPSTKSKYCSKACYDASRRVNHKIAYVKCLKKYVQMYQITVEGTHNYVLDNGMVSGNSQIELRVAAHESQDAALIHDFITGIDPHTSTAATAFGIAYEDVDPKKHRYPMKRAGFGVLYGISAKGLLELFESEGIEGWTEQSCQELIDLWFGVHAGVERYMFHVQQRVRQDGKVRDMFGRYKLVPEVYSAHYWLVSRGMRQACNYPIQAGAQEIIKEAMGQLMHVMPEFNGSGRVCTPLMQIHDELLFEVSDEQLTDVATVCKGIMENVVELCVPLKCDVEVGPSWGELKSFEM